MTDHPMAQLVETKQCFLPSYVELVMSSFKDKLRENYDITLCAQEKKFKTHKIILAASSDYFYKMFSKDFKEFQQNEIIFDSLNADDLEMIINYIYSGAIEFADENTEGILKAAHLFGYEKISQLCYDRLYESISPENCIGIMKIADLYSSFDLKEKCEIFLNENFSMVWFENEILKLDLSEISSLLQSDKIQVNHEEEIFSAVKNWINHDKINRKIHLNDLLKLVRLHLLSPKFIYDEVKTFCQDVPEISTLIMAAYEAMLMPEIMQNLPPRRITPNIFNETLLVSCVNNSELQLYKLLPSKNSSLTYYMPTNIAVKNYGITYIDNTIIIAGGFSIRNPTEISKKVIWIDLKTDSVIRESSLPERRRYFCVAAVKTEEVSVYVIGGIIRSVFSHTTSSVLLWNPKTLAWNSVASMKTERAQFGTAVIKNNIYVVGGKNEKNQPLNSMEIYDPVENVWSQCPPMFIERISPGVGAINGNLYVFGGMGENGELFSSVEQYNSSTNKWSFVKSLPKKSTFSKVAECKNRSLIAIGKEEIYQYMQELDEWFILTNVPKPPECMDILSVPLTF